MRQRLHTYSQILQLDTATMLDFKYAPDGLVRALQLFTVVTLIAGAGLWLGIAVQLDRPVLYEELDDAQEIVDSIAAQVEPFVAGNIPFLAGQQNILELIDGGAQAAGDTINELLLLAETEAELVSPPLGPRASRVIRLFGRWISVPVAILSEWLLLVLVVMLVAKALGGTATLGQHLTAVLLSAAPLLLLLPSYIPDMSPVMPVTVAFAIGLFANVIALVGYGWAALILLKGLALAHEFSWWRALGVLALSAFGLYIFLPLAGLLLAGFVWPF